MKHIFLSSIVCTLTTIWFPIHLTAEIIELCSGSTFVMGGEYNVSNNVWGASTAQCLEVDLDGTYFKVSLSEHNNTGGSPAAYPFIYKGCHWGGGCTTGANIMPMKINEIESAPFTWEITTDGVGGTWNAAFEAFFDSTGQISSSDYVGELMVWINYAGGAGPGGSYIKTVNIGGHEWYLFYAAAADWNGQWNYIAYKIKTVTNEVDLDFRDFIHDAVTHGYLNEEWYMHNMEAGFEIWRDGQGLTSEYYYAEVIEGEYVPVSVRSKKLVTPAFHLEQNYPNPFNAQTEIRFEIKRHSRIDLSVYDLAGRKVQTLEKGYFTPGIYQTTFDASNLPSGVYYYKLETSFQSQKQKCIYIK
jgi:hypothetical protein